MSLLQLINVDFSVGGPLLLERVNFSVEPRERVCVVGRNGAGKSTLLRLIAGRARPDDGEVRFADGVRVTELVQEVPSDVHGDVFDVVADGLGQVGALLAEFHHLSHPADGVAMDVNRMGQVQQQLDNLNGWTLNQRVERMLLRLGLPEDVAFAGLSGGMKRRVLLARALVGAPDVLLLDEPTNHLDLEAIEGLEQQLMDFAGAVIFVTHDRRFLRALATRIIEIDRGQLTSWPGDYENFLRRREERAHAEAQANARFDKLLAQEEVWIRQGIKARRTRNEGRVRALEALRRERAARRERVGKVQMTAADAGQSGRKVIELENVTARYGDRVLFQDFSTTVMRGDRIGLIGANGSGKTTLLNIMLGRRAPDAGTVSIGTQLSIAYFDQYRAQLDENANACENVAGGQEFVEINGQRKHVLGYLQEFLFSPDRARATISKLSGGERNRLLLAKLFAQPSNLLVLDEPTNDLDVETLELLEELLTAYTGTVLLVSHDREFLDAVVSSTIVLPGDGRIEEYVGGYSDWLRQRSVAASESKARAEAKAVAESVKSLPAAEPAKAEAPKKRLSYKDARELEQLPGRIEALETEISSLNALQSDPGFFSGPRDEIQRVAQRLAQASVELDAAYARWAELDG
ncbi:ABC transporter ATP-binding protein [Ahniella affigens]|uniref:ATP-binding protein Uup n=1 Tax=Ahniella affigens TaxID=2021234 RepID=A0A2P1PZH1_9GAMM|nr:ATP-binding cassette domain-containing protein [Ahniella affigens]AVQ00244.1 ABC transporter ATP-binding protein [Ahniella affigens]